jgi:hypothetical protein
MGPILAVPQWRIIAASILITASADSDAVRALVGGCRRRLAEDTQCASAGHLVGSVPVD